MAKLLSGTRIYGTANVDTSVSVGTSNTTTGTGGVLANTTTLFIGNNTINTTLTTVGLSINAFTVANTTGVYTGVVNGSSHTVGTSFIANTTGVYHTGIVNAASHTTGGGYGSATGGAIVNTTIVAVGNSTVNVSINATTFSGTSNNSTNLGGTAASGYQTTAGLSSNVATLSANNTTYVNGKTEGNLNVNSALTSNNSSNFNGQAAAYYTNATNITSGTLPWAQAPTNTVNTSAAFTFTGVHTHSANVSITGTTKMTGVVDAASANTLNQTLTDGVTVSWDVSLGQVASLTLAGNRTISNPTNMKIATYILYLVQDATGSRTVTWGTAYKWPGGVAPVLSTGANKRDIISFISDGTNMYGTYIVDVR
jgi:hypothetical protein